MTTTNIIIREIKTLLVLVTTMATLNVCAQRFPVGIVSVQDTAKGFQLGIISSIAEEGGHGVQVAGVSNMSAHTFNGLQLGSVSNITSGMDRGLQLSGILNVSSGMMRGWQWGAVNYADSLNGVQIGAFNIARKRPIFFFHNLCFFSETLVARRNFRCVRPFRRMDGHQGFLLSSFCCRLLSLVSNCYWPRFL